MKEAKMEYQQDTKEVQMTYRQGAKEYCLGWAGASWGISACMAHLTIEFGSSFGGLHFGSISTGYIGVLFVLLAYCYPIQTYEFIEGK